MAGRRLGPAGWDALARALADRAVVERYRSKLVRVEDSGCVWWTHAVSGRGHGRFWLGADPDGQGRVVIAHRFAWALVHGVEALRDAPVLGHRCDNPLCQRIGPDHVRASSALANRREWAARRHLAGTPLGDPRGARDRARELRDLARTDPGMVAADLAAMRALLGEQLALW